MWKKASLATSRRWRAAWERQTRRLPNPHRLCPCPRPRRPPEHPHARATRVLAFPPPARPLDAPLRPWTEAHRRETKAVLGACSRNRGPSAHQLPPRTQFRNGKHRQEGRIWFQFRLFFSRLRDGVVLERSSCCCCCRLLLLRFLKTEASSVFPRFYFLSFIYHFVIW